MNQPASLGATSPSIVARGLTRGYGSGAERRLVIDALALDFRPGELSLMMGASGSGKSTLLAMLGGLLRPEAGRVEILGTDLWQLDAAALERFRFAHFGFIFQGFNLFPALTAVEQVALPLRFSGVASAEAFRRAQWPHAASRRRIAGPAIRKYCSPMNLPVRSTAKTAKRSSPCCSV